jgi:hypothetical protein
MLQRMKNTLPSTREILATPFPTSHYHNTPHRVTRKNLQPTLYFLFRSEKVDEISYISLLRVLYETENDV